MYQYFTYAALVLISALCIVPVLGAKGLVPVKKMERLDAVLLKCGDLLGRFHIPLLLLLFAVFLFSRLVLLDIVPAGIHMDELGMAYDAKCLAKYGTDRHGIRYPFYLQAYGGGQSALYAYLASVCIRLFGYSVRVIRLPAVFCAVPCFFASYFLVKEMLQSKKWALLGPVFVTITPYFMMSERWALDCNLFLSLATVAFYFYYKAIKSEKPGFYIIAGISLGITLYTYVISYIVLPLFLLFATLYLIYIKKFDFKKTAALAVPLALLALPLFLMQFINMGRFPEFSTFLSDFKALPWYRGGEFSIGNIPKNLYYIKVLTCGGEWLTYNALYEYGPLYLFSLPLLIYGFCLSIGDAYRSLKHKTFDISVLILLFLFFSYFTLMLIMDLNMYKANEIFLPFILLLILAIRHLGEKSPVSVSLILLCFAIGFLSFSNFYFRHQNEEYGMHPLFLSTQLGDMLHYTETLYNPDGSKTVYIERQYDDLNAGDLTVGLYGNVPPSEWEQDGIRQGHFMLHLPENIDLEENAVYIIGQNWDFIVSYMISNGFQADGTFPSYTILYR